MKPTPVTAPQNKVFWEVPFNYYVSIPEAPNQINQAAYIYSKMHILKKGGKHGKRRQPKNLIFDDKFRLVSEEKEFSKTPIYSSRADGNGIVEGKE